MPVIPGVPDPEEPTPSDSSGPSYCVPGQVREALYPGGAADVGSASEMGEESIQDAINDAQVEIDARLAPLYGTAVPFDPVPPIITAIARDKAAYLATLTHRDTDIAPTDPAQLRNNRAEALLSGIQSGAIDLGIRDPSTGAAQESEMVDMVVNPTDNADFFTPADAGLVVTNDGTVTTRVNYPGTWGPGAPAGP